MSESTINIPCDIEESDILSCELDSEIPSLHLRLIVNGKDDYTSICFNTKENLDKLAGVLLIAYKNLESKE